MSVPAYTEYQASDAPWLGSIPKHWSLEPLRSQFDELKDKNVGALDQNYLSLVAGRGVMPYAEKGEMGNKKPDDLEKCKLVRAGNFVINSMNFGIGAFGVSAHNGVCSPVYVVLEPTEPRSLRYLRWIFDNPGFREVAQSFGNGILAHRAAIGWDDLKLMKIGVPPIEEQEAIAAFLDRETAKIDALVAEQERLIALLKEKRQAVISHAVTKGLDPDAPMKGSGIEWLGEIPSHWTQCKVKHIVTQNDGIQMGPFGGMLTDLLSEPTGYKVYGQENTISGDFDRGSRWLSEHQFTDLRRYQLQTGDLVLTRKGSLGGCRVVPDDITPGIADSDTIRLRLDSSRIVPEFFVYLLRDAHFIATQTDLNKRGAILAGINTSVVANTVLALPPIEEQGIIVKSLQNFDIEMQALFQATGDSLALLRERRAALISAAVTGKIDVRGLVERQEMEAA